MDRIKLLKEEIERQKKTEEEIGIFKTVVDRANYGVIFIDINAIIIYVNEAYSKLLGYTPDFLIGKDLYSFFPEKNQKSLFDINIILKNSDNYSSIEVLHRNKNNKEFPMLLNGTVIKDENGKPELLAITAIDIAERKQIETALRQNEEMLREMTEFLPAILWEFNRDLKLTYTNSIGFETFGYSNEELNKGMTILDMVHPSDKEKAMKDIRKVLQGEKAALRQYKLKNKDGLTINALINAAPIYKNGNISGVRGLIIDIKPFFFSTILPDDAFFKEYAFTKREKDVMILLAQGFKYKEISKKLGFTDNTLKTHMSNIYDKMGAGSRDEIVDIIKEFQVNYLGRDRLFLSILNMLMQD